MTKGKSVSRRVLSFVLVMVMALSLTTLFKQEVNAADSLTVTFNANGGTPATQIKTVSEGAVLGDPTSAVTRDKYKLTGWNTSPDGSGRAYTAESQIYRHMTLYAQWELTSLQLTVNILSMQAESSSSSNAITRYISIQTGATAATATTEIGRYNFPSVTGNQVAGTRTGSMFIDSNQVQAYTKIVYYASRTGGSSTYTRTFTYAASTTLSDVIKNAPGNTINAYLTSTSVTTTGTQTGTLSITGVHTAFSGSVTKTATGGGEEWVVESAYNNDKAGKLNTAYLIPGSTIQVTYSGTAPYMKAMSLNSGWTPSEGFDAYSDNGSVQVYRYEDIEASFAPGGYPVSSIYSANVITRGTTTVTLVTQHLPGWYYGSESGGSSDALSAAPSATVANATITGTVGTALSEQLINVSLDRDYLFIDEGSEWNAISGSWVSGLPKGITATAVRTSNMTAAITFSGTPETQREMPLVITVPAAVVSNSAASLKVTYNSAARMQIANAAKTLVPERITAGTTKFFVDNGTKEIWMTGVNTPYGSSGFSTGNSHLGSSTGMGGNFDTFGGGPWSDTIKQEWDDHFAALKANGVNSSRVWIVGPARGAGVVLNADGSFNKVNDSHWAKVDDLFDIAKKNGIYIMATLATHGTFGQSGTLDDDQKAFRNMVNDESLTDKYIDNYIIPFITRYGDNPYLFSIDLCNEPDLSINTLSGIQLTWNNMVRFFGKAAAAIHRNSDVLVTVGMNGPDQNRGTGSQVRDANMKSQSGINSNDATLDYYSPHYYGQYHSNYGYPLALLPVGSSAAWLSTADVKPTVLGELVANGSYPMNGSGTPNSGYTRLTPAQNFQDAYDNGWAGLYPWSSNGVDGCGGFSDIITATKPLAEKYPEKIFPLGQGGEVITVDKAELDALIAAADAFVEENSAKIDTESDVYGAFMAKYLNATLVSSSAAATQEEVDAASEELSAAFDALQEEVNAPVVPAAIFTLTSSKGKVNVGASFTVAAAFDRAVVSNIATLSLTYDASKYEYLGFEAGDGVSILDTRLGTGSVRLTVSVEDYAALSYGDFKFKAIAAVNLEDPETALIMVKVDYVVRDSAGLKTIQSQTAALGVAAGELIPGDVNDDGSVNLIDLSTLIDGLGKTRDDIDWEVYASFDFNNSGAIEAYDIYHLSTMIDVFDIGVESESSLSISSTYTVSRGAYFTVDMLLDKPVSSNTYMLNLEYNTELFSYAGYSAADGVNVIMWKPSESGMTVIFENDGDALLDLGHILFKAQDEADLKNGTEDIAITIVMVETIDDVKVITNSKAVLGVTTKDSKIFGDINGDGVFDLIDLSDIIDSFGLKAGEAGWDLVKEYDLNGNGEIDVNDIAVLASMLA